MKIRTFFLTWICLMLSLSLNATSWRVNNVDPTADFSTLDSAHTLASAGDTLYIEGSTVTYGSVTLTKKLTLIGPGYFPGQNPGTMNLTARVQRIEFHRTITNDPFSGASGSSVLGIHFMIPGLTGWSIDIEVSDLVIRKCHFDGENIRWVPNDVSNIMISQNYFTYYTFNFNSATSFNNLTFTNNIITDDFVLPDNSSGTIEHNLFLHEVFEVINFAGTVKDNIFANNQTNNFMLVASSNLVFNNSAANGQFGTSNDNNTVPLAGMFVGGNSPDGQYFPADPALVNTASDTTHRGPFGGTLPYCLSGLGGIPTILFLCVPPAGSSANPFTVRIKARSRN